MTATIESRSENEAARANGRVVRVIGPVVDVEFPPEAMPEVYFALTAERTIAGETTTLTFEVEQHIGDNMVRTISMQPTDGLVRGTEVVNTGSPIMVPVGNATKGHVFNTLGKPMDVPSVDADTYWPIHRQAPAYDQLGEMTESGVIDKTALVFGQMDEPPGTRLRVALSALTMAEYFRDEQKQDVLLFIDNIFRFTQAGSEVSTLLGRMPSAVGYQPNLADEMGQLQERITSTRGHSITSMQAIYVPADDY